MVLITHIKQSSYFPCTHYQQTQNSRWIKCSAWLFSCYSSRVHFQWLVICTGFERSATHSQSISILSVDKPKWLRKLQEFSSCSKPKRRPQKGSQNQEKVSIYDIVDDEVLQTYIRILLCDLFSLFWSFRRICSAKFCWFVWLIFFTHWVMYIVDKPAEYFHKTMEDEVELEIKPLKV